MVCDSLFQLSNIEFFKLARNSKTAKAGKIEHMKRIFVNSHMKMKWDCLCGRKFS